MHLQLTQRGLLDAEAEVLPQDPPPWIIRSTAWILLAAFLFAALIATVMRLPETVRCPFVLVPATGADPFRITRTSYHQPRGSGRRSTCESGRRIVRVTFR